MKSHERVREMKIGFIGLGNMGRPMAEVLVKAGYQVVGFDISFPQETSFVIESLVTDAAAGCDVIITMLPHRRAVRSVLNEIIPVLEKGALVIDCSTIDVDGARSCKTMCDEADLAFLDAPVSGGIAAAAAGSLTFMVGGADKDVARAMPLFDVMGAKTVHCGASGAGQAAKICNNMILGATMIATCEAFALADNLALKRDKLYEVVSGASGQSWSMTSYCPAPSIGPVSPSDNDYQPGFSADLMLKDLRLSQIAAETSGTRTEIGALATELYRRFVEEGDGSGQDFSAMLKQVISGK